MSELNSCELTYLEVKQAMQARMAHEIERFHSGFNDHLHQWVTVDIYIHKN